LISRLPSDEKPFMENMAIMLRPTSPDTKPELIGLLGIVRISSGGKAAEVGYGILPEHWGHGYAPEALKLFVDYYWTSESMPDWLTVSRIGSNKPQEKFQRM
jgi:RimJ/RimL family protein N-acetyltransferase